MIEHESGLPPIDRKVIKEVEFQPFMSWGLVEQWADGIPSFSDMDTLHPEWRPTPVIPLDLTSDGYGEVHVKNEADTESNPTGTIKDRAAWELATLYRDYARALYEKVKVGNLTKGEVERTPVPKFSMITAGNEGRAVAACFEKHDLPPPKLIVGLTTPESRLHTLQQLRADVYQVDLSRQALTAEEIMRLSNNPGGIDITSVRSIEPNAIFYDWHVHEAFNEQPDEIYVPYGSGRLMENYLIWQERTIRNESNRERDKRLRAEPGKIVSINVLGGEPVKPDSIADKLTARFKPFLIFNDSDISALARLDFTGRETEKVHVAEERIQEAFNIFQRHKVEAEPSAAAGLALYLERFSQGLIPKDKKILVVNTGRGIDFEETENV